MKWIYILGFSLVLVGCQQVVEYEEEEEQEVVEFSLDEELAWIEQLIGMEELGAARLALDDLLLIINVEVEDALHQSRINTILMLLEEVDPEQLILDDHYYFTGPDAVAIAMDHYEDHDDLVFMYHAQPSYFGEDQMGYYVVLKSQSLMEYDQNSDGIVLTLFVSNEGEIVEIES